MARELLYGDFLGYFKGELHRGRRRSEELAPKTLRWKLIEREIPADDRKCFGVFVQAFFIETFLRKSAPRQVALPRIDLPQPALIFPRTGSDEYVFLGQCS